MRKSIFVTALAGVLVWAGVASAAPLDPPFIVGIGGGAAVAGGTTAGEGAAPNTCVAPLAIGSGCAPPGLLPTAVQHLDWLVVNDGNPNGGWSYYYQMENSSSAELAALNIASANFIAVGFILVPPGQDLDAGIPAGTVITQTAIPPLGGGAAIIPNPPAAVAFHAGTVGTVPGNPAPGPFVNLDITDGVGGEHELCGFSCPDDPLTLLVDESLVALTCCVGPDSVVIIPGQSTSFFFTGLDPGEESSVIVGQGAAPIYVNWNTSGAGNTWNNQQANPLGEAGRMVAAPGPIPEPASLLLLGSGLAGLGFWARRRQS